MLNRPNRNLNKISDNTKRILAAVKIATEPKIVSVAAIEDTHIDKIAFKEAMNSKMFKDAGMGLYKESYKNVDYGKIWVKKTVTAEDGTKQDWLVVYTNDDEDLIRQVATSVTGLKKVAAANVATTDWVNANLPQGWQKLPPEEVITHLIDQAWMAPGVDQADISYSQMKDIFEKYKNHRLASKTAAVYEYSYHPKGASWGSNSWVDKTVEASSPAEAKEKALKQIEADGGKTGDWHIEDKPKSEKTANNEGKVPLELVGLDGNAFVLMGAFRQAARKAGWSPDQIKAVLDDCMSGDYDHLLQVLVANTYSPDEDSDEDFDTLEMDQDEADYNGEEYRQSSKTAGTADQVTDAFNQLRTQKKASSYSVPATSKYKQPLDTGYMLEVGEKCLIDIINEDPNPGAWTLIAVHDTSGKFLGHKEAEAGAHEFFDTVNNKESHMKVKDIVKTAGNVDPKNIPIAEGIKSKDIKMNETGGGGTATVTIEFTDVNKGLDFYQNEVSTGKGVKEAPEEKEEGEAGEEQPAQPPQAKGPQMPPQPQQQGMGGGLPQQGASLKNRMQKKAEAFTTDAFGQRLLPGEQVKNDKGQRGTIQDITGDQVYVKWERSFGPGEDPKGAVTSVPAASITKWTSVNNGFVKVTRYAKRNNSLGNKSFASIQNDKSIVYTKYSYINEQGLEIPLTFVPKKVGQYFDRPDNNTLARFGGFIDKFAIDENGEPTDDYTPDDDPKGGEKAAIDIHVEAEPDAIENILDNLMDNLGVEEGDKIEGGKADNLSDEDFDPKELAEGEEHEKEHTDDDEIAKEIAKDHLEEQKEKGEDETYYDDLDKMEKKEEKESSLRTSGTVVEKDGKWEVESHKGKNLGTYDTKEEAEKRLKEVEYFKHKEGKKITADWNEDDPYGHEFRDTDADDHLLNAPEKTQMHTVSPVKEWQPYFDQLDELWGNRDSAKGGIDTPYSSEIEQHIYDAWNRAKEKTAGYNRMYDDANWMGVNESLEQGKDDTYEKNKSVPELPISERKKIQRPSDHLSEENFALNGDSSQFGTDDRLAHLVDLAMSGSPIEDSTYQATGKGGGERPTVGTTAWVGQVLNTLPAGAQGGEVEALQKAASDELGQPVDYKTATGYYIQYMKEINGGYAGSKAFGKKTADWNEGNALEGHVVALTDGGGTWYKVIDRVFEGRRGSVTLYGSEVLETPEAAIESWKSGHKDEAYSFAENAKIKPLQYVGSTKTAADVSDQTPPMGWVNKDSQNDNTGYNKMPDNPQQGQPLPPNQNLNNAPGDVLYDSTQAQPAGQKAPAKFQVTTDPVNKKVEVQWLDDDQEQKLDQAIDQGAGMPLQNQPGQSAPAAGQQPQSPLLKDNAPQQNFNEIPSGVQY